MRADQEREWKFKRELRASNQKFRKSLSKMLHWRNREKNR